ncbi:MAG: FGGY family carbohydrate kinase, partial [Anaerolineae bacterium]|nr:FGGY family carbohydrate kinase [Anaerolineae bacterium]
MTLLLGIDAGTTVIKAALFDAAGQERGTASRPAPVLMPQPGWMEADMNAIYDLMVATIREVLATTGTPGRAVAAIGLTGNMVGAWLIDADGAPVRPAILWNDGRTLPWLAARTAATPEFMTHIFHHSGSVMQPGCTLPLVRWLAAEEPAALARARAVLNCKDWLSFKLTGNIANDPTQAAVFPGDTRARSYAEDLFGWLEVDAYRHLFPPVVESAAVMGTLHAAAAAATGLAAGTPVVAGAGDVPATALGAGAVQPGVACTLLGTSCINGLVLAEPSFTPADVGLLFCLPGAGWLRAMINIAGTTNLDWYVAQFGPPDLAQHPQRFAHLEALAQSSPPGARGLLYLPYLTPVGVIAPFVEPAARAGFFGLSVEHTRADALRAVYEGVVLAIRDCYAAIPAPIAEIRLSGGGAR